MAIQLLSRRGALLGLGAAVTLGRASLAMAAAPTDRRLVVVILRGALDGMAAVVPYGDAALAGLRADLLPPAPGQPGGMLDLGGFFGLNPALAALQPMYAAGELLPVHAVAGPVRTRSHFEAQDLMESGAEQRLSSGWLNRAVLGMAPRGDTGAPLSIGVALPLLLRGPATVGAYAPQSFSQPQPDLYARLVSLHQHDAVTGPAIREGLVERGFTLAQLSGTQGVVNEAPRDKYAFATLAGTAGRLLAAADGPRIAAMELGGWDTHAGQNNRLAGPLRQLADGLVAMQAGMGEAWGKTAILVMTEFGRTVRPNGTGGTDHGTGTVAFVAGGAVAGGRVLADWPGLGAGRLLEGRDLQPTMDLRSLAKGLLASHLGLQQAALLRAFPGSEAAPPVSGLVRA